MASSETAHGTHNNNNNNVLGRSTGGEGKKESSEHRTEINISPNMRIVITISVLKTTL